jgi:hypothetical protein
MIGRAVSEALQHLWATLQWHATPKHAGSQIMVDDLDPSGVGVFKNSPQQN